MQKKYWVLLILLFLVGLDWYIRAPDSRSRQPTGAIATQASAQLKSYPYTFRAMSVSGEAAVMGTPRSVEVPALNALGVLFPNINTKNPDDPQFIAAERLLAEVQAEARSIVLAQRAIETVRWELDRDWLVAHNIDAQLKWLACLACADQYGS